MKSEKLLILYINQKKSLEMYKITQLSQYNYNNGYYIYELKT